MLASWWGDAVEIEWREALTLEDEHRRPAFALRVGPAARPGQPATPAFPSASGRRIRPLADELTGGCAASDVRVWQSVDCALVVAIAASREEATAVDGSKLFHVALAPAPPVDAAAVASLHFSFSVQGAAQTLKPWNLLGFEPHAHHLLLNLGSSVSVLVFHVQRRAFPSPEEPSRPQQRYPWDQTDTPRGPGVSFFAQSALVIAWAFEIAR